MDDGSKNTPLSGFDYQGDTLGTTRDHLNVVKGMHLLAKHDVFAFSGSFEPPPVYIIVEQKYYEGITSHRGKELSRDTSPW